MTFQEYLLFGLLAYLAGSALFLRVLGFNDDPPLRKPHRGRRSEDLRGRESAEAQEPETALGGESSVSLVKNQ